MRVIFGRTRWLHTTRLAQGCAVLVCAAAISSLTPTATSVLFGIEPGKSTRAQAEKVFGAPLRDVSDLRRAYAPAAEASAIEIEYSAAQIVERIDLTFRPALDREVVVRGFNLAGQPDGSRVQDGRLVEYYAGSRTLVLSHDGGDLASGISVISYCSPALFETLTAGVVKLVDGQPASAAAQLSNPDDQPLIVQHNPGGCQEVYVWAQREHETARRARDAVRRQRILEIMVLAQRGDCTTARTLAERYRAQYR